MPLRCEQYQHILYRDVTRLGLGGLKPPKRRRSTPNEDGNKSFLHCCFGHHAPVIEGYLSGIAKMSKWLLCCCQQHVITPNIRKGLICLKLGTYIHEKALSFRGLRSLTSWPGALPLDPESPQIPVIASRSPWDSAPQSKIPGYVADFVQFNYQFNFKVKCEEAKLTRRTADIFAWQMDSSATGWEYFVIVARAPLATATAVWQGAESTVVCYPRLTDRLHNTVTCYIGCNSR